MQNLFNAAALNGGYYNTAALDGGMYNTAALEGGLYNTAALEGGSELYDEAAVVGGFALAKLATSDSAPNEQDLVQFGYETLKTLPPSVRDTIAKMFDPKSKEDLRRIYIGMALLYLLDSLKAISIAPEMDITAKNIARQRWLIVKAYLQRQPEDQQRAYIRLLRYIHIPHHSPRACKSMRDRWLNSVNNRNLQWGRSRAYHALPRGLSTVKYGKPGLEWNQLDKDIPSVRKRKGKKRSAKTSAASSPKKNKPGRYDERWLSPMGSAEDDIVLPPGKRPRQ